jgi:hypothetical protein
MQLMCGAANLVLVVGKLGVTLANLVLVLDKLSIVVFIPIVGNLGMMQLNHVGVQLNLMCLRQLESCDKKLIRCEKAQIK